MVAPHSCMVRRHLWHFRKQRVLRILGVANRAPRRTQGGGSVNTHHELEYVYLYRKHVVLISNNIKMPTIQ